MSRFFEAVVEAAPPNKILPSLKLTFSHPKMDGWNTRDLWEPGLFSGAALVLRSVVTIKGNLWKPFGNVGGIFQSRFFSIDPIGIGFF